MEERRRNKRKEEKGWEHEEGKGEGRKENVEKVRKIRLGTKIQE